MTLGPQSYRARIYANYVASHGTYSNQAQKRLNRPLPHAKAFVRKFFPSERGARILDIGCGSGELIWAGQQEGYSNLVGIDAAEDQVGIARIRGLDVVRKADAIEYLRAEEDGSFKCVVAYDILEHLTRDELFSLCDLVFSKLEKGGRFVIHSPNAEGIFGARVRYGDLTHELAFTPASMTQLARLVGFSRIECYPDRPRVHNLRSAIRYVAWLLVESAIRVAFAADTGRPDGIFTQNLIAVAIK